MKYADWGSSNLSIINPLCLSELAELTLVGMERTSWRQMRIRTGNVQFVEASAIVVFVGSNEAGHQLVPFTEK